MQGRVLLPRRGFWDKRAPHRHQEAHTLGILVVPRLKAGSSFVDVFEFNKTKKKKKRKKKKKKFFLKVIII